MRLRKHIITACRIIVLGCIENMQYFVTNEHKPIVY